VTKTYSTVVRNAWVGDLVCLCYGTHELRQMMDGGESDCIEEGLGNGLMEVRKRGSMKEKGGMFFLVWNFLVVAFFKLRLVVDELRCANDLT